MTHSRESASTCDWCGKPAVKRLVLEPPVFDGTKLIKRQKYADVCAEHMHVRDKPPGQPEKDLRRRSAKGVQQTTIFDVLDGPTDAIRGG